MASIVVSCSAQDAWADCPAAMGGACVRAGCFAVTLLQALAIAGARSARTANWACVASWTCAQEVAEEGRGPMASYADIRCANLLLKMAATEIIAHDQVMHHLYLGSLAPVSSVAQAVQQLREFSDRSVLLHRAAGRIGPACWLQ